MTPGDTFAQDPPIGRHEWPVEVRFEPDGAIGGMDVVVPGHRTVAIAAGPTVDGTPRPRGRRGPPAKRVSCIGTIKWRDTRGVDAADHRSLRTAGARVPGVGPETITVAVSRLGADSSARRAFGQVLDADDLLAAWDTRSSRWPEETGR